MVGLGNPGPAYAGHRHTIGAVVVHDIARESGARFSKHKARADVADLRLPPVRDPETQTMRPGPRLILAVPHTYMNESGGPVSGLLTFFSVPTDRLLVVHDELDLPLAVVRLKRGGGEGGHNGLRSISRSIGTKDYHRIRLGIGRPPGRQDPADFVLRDFAPAERADIAVAVADAADAVRDIAVRGWERVQNDVNSRTVPG